MTAGCAATSVNTATSAGSNCELKLVKLTNTQRQAVESWGPDDVCVVAGPGSGKTTVLVERFRWLVSEKGFRPDEILAITFTEKAAANMLERLVTKSDTEHRAVFQTAQISTIHAFCARLLREHAFEAGLDPGFEVIDAWEAEVLLRRSIADVLDERHAQHKQGTLAFLRAFYGSGAHAERNELSNVHGEIFDLYQTQRASGREITDAQPAEPPQQDSRRWLLETLRQVDDHYLESKRRYGWLDFADLEIESVRLLSISSSINLSYRAILVDEYQDTNRLQADLISLLRERTSDSTLFAVGDLNQSIYGFRHAEPRVFHDYRDRVRESGGQVVELLENFRSRDDILRAVETVFDRPSGGVEPRKLKAARLLPRKRDSSVEVLVARGPDSARAREAEAQHLAARIIDLRGSLLLGEAKQPAEWKDFAVLGRTRAVLADITKALQAAGIPYQVSAGRGFFEAEEVRDLVNFLRVLRNPRDDISLAAVLCSPLAGLSDDALLEMKLEGEFSRDLASALGSDKLTDPEDTERLAQFRSRLDRFRQLRDETPVEVLISRLLAETGYESQAFSADGGDRKVANIRKLLRLIRQLQENRRLRLHEVVDRLEELQSSAVDEPEADAYDEDLDAVKVLTVHGAKGLEFPVVIIAGLNRDARGSSNAALYDPDKGLGVRWVEDAATGEAKGDAMYEAIRQRLKERDRDETDRLLYVAMTRAEEHLILSASFGPRPQARHWAKHLKEKLGVDFSRVENKPMIQEKNGFRFRCLVTDQKPALQKELFRPGKQSEVTWIDPAGEAEQSDAAAAVTSVVLFTECPRRYYLSRYLGFSDRTPHAPRVDEPDDWVATERDEKDATTLGKRVHEVLGGSAADDSEDAEALALARRFIESELGRRAARADSALREHGILFLVGNHLLRGQIDLWFEEGGEQVIVDYKTDDADKDEAVVRAEHYALQIQLYAMAMRLATGRLPSRGVLYFLRPGIAHDVDLSELALEAAGRVVEEFFAAQSAVQFPLHLGAHCLRCPHYRGICPAEIPAEGRAAVVAPGT